MGILSKKILIGCTLASIFIIFTPFMMSYDSDTFYDYKEYGWSFFDGRIRFVQHFSTDIDGIWASPDHWSGEGYPLGITILMSIGISSLLIAAILDLSKKVNILAKGIPIFIGGCLCLSSCMWYIYFYFLTRIELITSSYVVANQNYLFLGFYGTIAISLLLIIYGIHTFRTYSITPKKSERTKQRLSAVAENDEPISEQ